MRYLLLSLLIPVMAQAQATTIDPGCYISFTTGQCQEQEKNFVWLNYGPEENKVVYGAPVAALINQALNDRELLEDWIAYAEKLKRNNKKLRRALILARNRR